jgi:hypothetical protein
MSIEILSRFRTQLLNFMDELIQQFPEETDFVIFKLFLSNQMPIQTAMELFKKQLNKDEKCVRTMIKARNEQFFFVESNFPFVSAEKMQKMIILWKNLEPSDQNVMWSWIDTLVSISDKY